jgi:hypothetical protein
VESSPGLDLVADSCNGDSGGGLTATNFNGREVDMFLLLLVMQKLELIENRFDT